MRGEWWTLPGPASFVEEVEGDLRRGRNVVLSLPLHLPDGIRGAVQARLRDEWLWTTLPASATEGKSPLEVLFERCATNAARQGRHSASAFAEQAGEEPRIIWIDALRSASWPAWRRFLVEYEQACRGVPAERRTTLCLVRIGEAATEVISSNVCLVDHRYRGRVTDLDMLLFASFRLSSRGCPPAMRRLLATLIARLAPWDPGLAVALADLPPERVIDPSAALRAFAAERRWDGGSISWEAGTVDEVEGRQHVHSAAISLRDARGEIGRRVWSAQVEVLLPWVEERRRDLIDQLPRALRVPFTREDGSVIHDIADLEIGIVCHQLASAAGVRNDQRQLARLLRDVRNSLAHLEPLPAELALRACG